MLVQSSGTTFVVTSPSLNTMLYTKTYAQFDGFGQVNGMSDEPSKLATDYLPQEIALFRVIVRRVS